ncbi:carbamoyl phosphate synthase small subunit [Caldalkalibacillus mannanilyticus]|uniref:carbamoyl phosphate synthase small subunit n=1 Tax=Caldalkalibacillus mannanilyticus TaxID=1418 RepID=UPI0004694166|nr:carbamoyl phosphate synthase small subunit [Caldalkalibacillus mannanilyticus]
MGKGYLVLESGEIFEGEIIGNSQEVIGEVVFNTSMTGYQEMITDPSYAGQILVFCYPLIGNYGVNPFDSESTKPHVAGVIIGDVCLNPSHYQANQSFSAQLEQAGVSGLTGVDTRALVQIIRKHGTLRGIVTPHLLSEIEIDYRWQQPNVKQLLSKCWVQEVSTKEWITYEHSGPHVALIDYGYKKSILDALLQAECKVTVLPYDVTYAELLTLQPDGVLFSNGPGDPMSLKAMFGEIKKITEAFPSMGICLGHQLIALAHGAKTTKLTYGHRGGNHPVKEIFTGKVRMTSQNHGYVVLDESINKAKFEITYRNVNDGSIEGLQHKHLPIQTVQFHPEAHPGPSDTDYLFMNFIQQLTQVGEMKYAIK